MMEHQFYMPRLVSELMDALRAEGVARPTEHFAIYNLPSMRRNMMLLSKRPLTDETRRLAFGELTPEVFEHIHLLYPAADSLQGNLINRIVQNGWRAEQDSAALDLSPCTDNRPYTAQLGLWKNFSLARLTERVSPLAEVMGFPLAKVLMVAILLIVTILVLPLTLLPALRHQDRLRPVPWIYFFTTGLAFMMVEVILIQQYTLFIGPSIYGIATILLTLLLASGIGSRFADRVPVNVVFGCILGWVLLNIAFFPTWSTALAPLTLIARVLVTAVMVAPLGFFMGMPFPKGALRVGSAIPWGLAVNGTASVIGSTLIVLLAFSLGFRWAFATAGLCYGCAWLLLVNQTRWGVQGATVGAE
jgi:hypothetical protein